MGEYDINRYLTRNWDRLAPRLAGKLHVYTGEKDTFYLEGTVRLLKRSLETLGSDAVVEILPGRDHSTLLDSAMRVRASRRRWGRRCAGRGSGGRPFVRRACGDVQEVPAMNSRAKERRRLKPTQCLGDNHSVPKPRLQGGAFLARPFMAGLPRGTALGQGGKWSPRGITLRRVFRPPAAAISRCRVPAKGGRAAHRLRGKE